MLSLLLNWFPSSQLSNRAAQRHVLKGPFERSQEASTSRRALMVAAPFETIGNGYVLLRCDKTATKQSQWLCIERQTEEHGHELEEKASLSGELELGITCTSFSSCLFWRIKWIQASCILIFFFPGECSVGSKSIGRERKRRKLSYWKMEYLESPEEGKFSVRKKSTIL